MLLALLFLSQVGCEWVEISQQHYHKPNLYNHPLTTSKAKESETTTKANRIYINNSLPEYNWNKGTVYNPETNDVTRVKLVRSTVIPVRNPVDNSNEKHQSSDVTEYVYNNDRVKHVPKPDLFKNLRVTNENEKLTNPYNDNVKGIYPINTPKDYSRHEMNTERPIEVLNLSDIEYVTEEDVFKTIEFDDDILISNIGQKRIKHINGVVLTSDQGNGRTEANRSPGNRFRNSETVKHDRHEHGETNPIYTKQETFTGVGKTKSDIEIPNVGSVKLIHSTEHPVIGNERKQIISALDESSFGLLKKNIILEGTQHPQGTVQRVPYIANIKQVQLVKTPAQTSQSVNYEINEGAEFSYASNINSATDVFNNNVIDSKKNLHSVPHINKVQNDNSTAATKNAHKIYNPSKRLNAPNPEDIMIQEILMEDGNKLVVKNYPVSDIDMVNKIHHMSNYKVSPIKISPYIDGDIRTSVQLKPEFVSENTVSVHQNEYATHHSTNTKNVKVIQSIESTEDLSFLPNRNKTKINDASEIGAKVKPINKSLGNVYHGPKQESVTKVNFTDDYFKNDSVTSTAYTHKFNTEATPTESAKDRVNVQDDNKKSTSKNQDAREEDQHPKSGHASDDTKTNTMENVVKLIKIVTDTISRNTRKSFNSKMRYLQELKDTILATIEDRIESAFPDDIEGVRRRARSAQAHAPRGHVEFPSSESALMTISFLTFAVFLIKLVVQVIHTYKNKAMVMPAVVATVGRAASSVYTRRPHHN